MLLAVVAARPRIIHRGTGILLASAADVTGVGAGGPLGALVAQAATVVGSGVSLSTGVGAPTSQSAAIDGTGTAAPLDGIAGLTGAWSMSRKLLSSYAGSFYEDISGNVATLYDQSGSARDLANATAGERPLVSTAGPNNIPSASFDGVDNRLNSAAAISTFIANNAGYIICSVVIDAINTNNATIFNNDPVWIDSGNFCGVYGKSAPTVQAYNFDGTADETTAISITTGSARVIEWWHSGGTLNCRVNKGTAQSVSSGNTQTMTGTLQIAADNSGGTQNWIDMHLFEMAAFSTVPDSTTRDLIAQRFMEYTGAT